MMQASEYRIGNWVSNGEVDYQITGATILHLEIKPSDAIAKPIPITPEWLERFGLITDKTDNVITLYENDCFDLRCSWDDELGFQIWFESDYHESAVKNIKYIHQLQNLYFALTGEEITTKEQ